MSTPHTSEEWVQLGFALLGTRDDRLTPAFAQFDSMDDAARAAECHNALLGLNPEAVNGLMEYVKNDVSFYERKPYRSSWEDEKLEAARAAIGKLKGDAK